jgi:HTH-type transcriptional regulator / antitoxin HigA
MSKTPGDYIREELARKAWGQDDLASVLGRPASRVNELVQGKLAVSPEIAAALAAALGGTAEEWMQREASHRLSASQPDIDAVRARARLFALAPIKDLQKRGWIRATDNPSLIEADLCRLFELKNIEDEPQLSALMRKTDLLAELTPAQRAWCFRVRQLARCVPVSEFRENRLPQCERDLRKLAAYSKEVRKVPGVLAQYGIRYIVVEPLPGIKVDGMATWLSADDPVIGMSLRFDRIDGYWHTLCHELKHIAYRDELSVDDEVADPGHIQLCVKSLAERRADEGASAMLIDPDELKSFILRVGPLYSKERINQFANRIKIHPGIIVGQLQHRGEIGFRANREMLVKIRESVTPVALTDGWGHYIDERTLQ